MQQYGSKRQIKYQTSNADRLTKEKLHLKEQFFSQFPYFCSPNSVLAESFFQRFERMSIGKNQLKIKSGS